MDYTNINVIADRIKRHPLLEDIPFETILDNAIEFVKILGIPKAYLEKTDIVEIEDYRGVLPCDFYKIIQARTLDGAYFRESTDSFHMSPAKEKEGHARRLTGVTYKIQGNYIFTSMPRCLMEIAYWALPIGEDGMPLIPDNGTYPRALEYYIKMKCFEMLFDQGKITPQAYANVQQQYGFAVKLASNDLVRPSLDMMESISNSWNKLLPGKSNHNDGYVMEGARQYIKRH
jgi:hypothetical protein